MDRQFLKPHFPPKKVLIDDPHQAQFPKCYKHADLINHTFSPNQQPRYPPLSYSARICLSLQRISHRRWPYNLSGVLSNRSEICRRYPHPNHFGKDPQIAGEFGQFRQSIFRQAVDWLSAHCVFSLVLFIR